MAASAADVHESKDSSSNFRCRNAPTTESPTRPRADPKAHPRILLDSVRLSQAERRSVAGGIDEMPIT